MCLWLSFPVLLIEEAAACSTHQIIAKTQFRGTSLLSATAVSPIPSVWRSPWSRWAYKYSSLAWRKMIGRKYWKLVARDNVWPIWSRNLKYQQERQKLEVNCVFWVSWKSACDSAYHLTYWRCTCKKRAILNFWPDHQLHRGKAADENDVNIIFLHRWLHIIMFSQVIPAAGIVVWIHLPWTIFYFTRRNINIWTSAIRISIRKQMLNWNRSERNTSKFFKGASMLLKWMTPKSWFDNYKFYDVMVEIFSFSVHVDKLLQFSQSLRLAPSHPPTMTSLDIP